MDRIKKDIRFKIPFFEQGYNECGPICLKMVLEYFGEHHSELELKNLVESDSTGTTWAIGLVKAAASLGFKVDFYTTYLGVNPENYNLMYYVTQTDGYEKSKVKVNKIIEIISKDPKVKLIENSLSLDEILKKINNDCVVISEVNWCTVIRENGYLGHFVLIVGYDEKNVYIHQILPGNPQPYFPIKRKVFNKARNQLGTDQNLIFIYRKNK
ncbi:MAG: peptidase C39 family protein [Candidatus Hodarchaeota archaeon]